MRYQKIESRIWHDEKFISLNPSQQRLFFYILTSPHNNLIGMYVLKPGYACEDLKCLPKDFDKDLWKLIERGLVRYDFEVSVILIKNFLKHNPITNPNQKIAARKYLLDLPKTPLIQAFIDLNEFLFKGLGEGLREVLLKPEEEEETEEREEAEEWGPKGPLSTPRDVDRSPGLQKLAKLWNAKAPQPLSRVHLPFSRPNGKTKKLMAVCKRHPLEWWEAVFDLLPDRPFLLGVNDRGWKATFDFVVEKAEEIADGKYSGTKAQGQTAERLAGPAQWLENRRRARENDQPG